LKSDISFYQAKLSSITAVLSKESHLLIVSKNRSIEEIKIYYDLGHRDFGENKVQELIQKSQDLALICPEIRWHMIGHLQSNKIKQLLTVPNLVAIHSVDDESLLLKILSFDEKIMKHKIGIFLQVNTSKEEEKSGYETEEEILKSLNHFYHKKHFFLQGLMTMGKIRTDDFKKDALICFKLLNSYREKCEGVLGHSLQTSMGMSQDYEIALEEGTNWIRLGSILFS